MPKSYFVLGDWNATCDVCGFRYKASQMLKRWDGLMVCKQDFEVRHPQDFIRGVEDDPSVPWARPESDLFLTYPYICTPEGSMAISGQAVAGCAIAGRTQDSFPPYSGAVAGLAIAGIAIAGKS